MISITKLFSQTLHEAPAEAETRGFQLLLRAGYISHLGSGFFSLLPPAKRILDKTIQFLAQLLEESGSLEIDMPSLSPNTNIQSISVMATRDQQLISSVIRSHRQLPVTVHYRSREWNENHRLKTGLLDARETICFRSFSLAASEEKHRPQVQETVRVTNRFFDFCRLPVKHTSDDGIRPDSHQYQSFYLPLALGTDAYLECPNCSYSARQETARFDRNISQAQEIKSLEKVATPNAATIQELAAFLTIPPSQTAKAVFWMAELPDHPNPVFLFLVVRGDMEVSKEKVKHLLACQQIWLATDEDIRRIGAEPGYASPIGIKPQADLRVVVDESIPDCLNLVAGANEHGFHLLNTNYGRDYTADLVADIAYAQAGSACPQCKSELQLVNGVELAALSTQNQSDCSFQDLDGTTKTIQMSSMNIQLSRVLACLAEIHQDAAGLCLPPTLAPFPIHLIVLKGKTVDTSQIAVEICQTLREHQLEVLVDDRNESAGVKFNDADLIGLPIRITLSERSLQAGGVEYKKRTDPDKKILPISDILNQINIDLAE